MKLCITEKPSVAKDIARVIGSTQRHNGYFEGNGYIVTWAIGHLVGFAEPDAYGFVHHKDIFNSTEFTSRAFNELPLIPPKFKLIVNEKTRKQFNVIRGLIARKDIEYIIDCGDMGAEGHVLQQMIRDKLNCKLPVKRFCATSLTDSAIKAAMNNLRDVSEFEKIIRGQYCKKKADWILGMSMSRAMSIKHRTHIAVGRVMSPTLYFIVKRHIDILNFKETNYFTMKAALKEGVNVSWDSVTEKVHFFNDGEIDDEGKVLSEPKIRLIAEKIKETNTGTVLNIINKRKKTNPQQLYDTTDLQKDANKIYGYSASLTLAAAQCLYETHKVLSYPRTDSKYITDDLATLIESRIAGISTIHKYERLANFLLNDGLTIDNRTLDNSKVTDHHAIMPTENIKDFNMENLIADKSKDKNLTSEVLSNILSLVLTRTLIAFSKPYVYDSTVVNVLFLDFVFSAIANTPVSLGWKNIAKQLSDDKHDDNDTEIQEMPELSEGQTVHINTCEVLSKKTTAPKYHTDGTLLTAMQNAGSTLGTDGNILKGKGIGTRASQDEVISKIITSGAATYEKQSKIAYIKPTDYGIAIIRELPEELRSPKITADWEILFEKIVSGESDENEFMEKFEEFISKQIEIVANNEPSAAFTREKEVHGSCCWCGSDVYVSKESTTFYCSNYKDGCSWRLNLNDNAFNYFLGRKLKSSEAKTLIAKGQLDLLCNIKGFKIRKTFAFTKKKAGDKTFCNIMVS